MSHVDCPAGNSDSYKQAFTWRRYVVRHILNKPDKTPHERERTCECLHSLGLLLEDHCCGSNSELDNWPTNLLAVGAYMTGLRQVDANETVIAWISSHVEV